MTSHISPPLILGIGGTPRTGSSSELALRTSLAAAERAGARTRLITASELMLPLYTYGVADHSPQAQAFLSAVAEADGLIISTPSYHGGVSGLIKNALDYIEELRGADRPYLDGRAVGCIVTAGGWQATTTTLVSLRQTVHALRGWPAPLGVAINTTADVFDAEGEVVDANVRTQLDLVADQVLGFALNNAPVPVGG